MSCNVLSKHQGQKEKTHGFLVTTHLGVRELQKDLYRLAPRDSTPHRQCQGSCVGRALTSSSFKPSTGGLERMKKQTDRTHEKNCSKRDFYLANSNIYYILLLQYHMTLYVLHN